MDQIVFDIETKESFEDVGGRNPEKLSVSCVGIYSYNRDEFRAFTESELNEFWPWLASAELIIGYNSNYFDIPILARYWSQIDKIQSLDLHEEIQKSAGHRAKLDDIAQATLGSRKSGNGLEAIKMFQEGRIEELKKYCLNDVKITKEIYEFGKKEGRVLLSSFSQNKEIPVDFKPQIKQANSIELSLGF